MTLQAKDWQWRDALEKHTPIWTAVLGWVQIAQTNLLTELSAVWPWGYCKVRLEVSHPHIYWQLTGHPPHTAYFVILQQVLFSGLVLRVLLAIFYLFSGCLGVFWLGFCWVFFLGFFCFFWFLTPWSFYFMHYRKTKHDKAGDMLPLARKPEREQSS